MIETKIMETKIMDAYQKVLFEMVPFDVTLIKITREVRKACEDNLCGNYGKNYTCPPNVESLEAYERIIKGFQRGIVFSQIYKLSKSYDYQGMLKAGKEFRKKIQEMKKELESPEASLMFLGAGTCSLCKTCGILEDIPCRFEKERLVSLEAAGVDVVRLSRELKMKYNNGAKTVTYFGMVIF